MSETDLVRERYARRQNRPVIAYYHPLYPAVYMAAQERERALIRWIHTCDLAPVEEKRVLEVGCGLGDNLLQFMRLGFRPENLTGNELLPDRLLKARERLPNAIALLQGDASELPLEVGQFDVVFQSVVFSSLLDEAFQRKLADRMWSLVKPGGGILWYDFVFNNPANPDVRGISEARIQTLFPEGTIKTWRLTLAPPISRKVTKLHPGLYTVCNLLPFLRTHRLCWIHKTGT
jgi:SAM-dependent methyltransferase